LTVTTAFEQRAGGGIQAEQWNGRTWLARKGLTADMASVSCARSPFCMAAGPVSRRPPARRTWWLDGFPWRQLAWSALAGALAAVLAALALLWSGWTIW
jgi:hypothetical protein